MRILIAGGTGAIGRPLVQCLISAHHEVFGTTRSKENAGFLAGQGAEPVLLDVFNAAAVHSAISRIRPDVVIDQLTSLPKTYSAESLRNNGDINTRTHQEGGSNVLSAAQSVGVKRFMIQSAAFFYSPGSGLADESTALAFDGPPAVASSTRDFAQLEQRTVSASIPEIVILRYGFFYGPGTWYDREGSIADQVRRQEFPVLGEGEGVSSFIHIQDAADATCSALERDPGICNIVDDDPSAQRTWLPAYANWLGAPPPPFLALSDVNEPNFVYYATRLRGASNAKAKRELHWTPRKLEWLTPSK
jgi:nucleoside-diphosphate-sugar epimerase